MLHLDHTNAGKLILTNKDLASTDLAADATFNVLMQSTSAFLEDQFMKRAMDSATIATVLSQVSVGTQANAVQYLLERDSTSLKNAILHYQLEVAEIEVTHANQKTQLNELAIKEGEQRLELNLVNIELAKKDLELKESQIELNKAEVEIKKLELELKREELEIKKQELVIQLEIAKLNKDLIAQKVVTEKAQTSDTNENGVPYTGVIGAQTSLVKQQRLTFISESELKFCKVLADTYASRKAIDEGTETPEVFDKKSINNTFVKSANTLGINLEV